MKGLFLQSFGIILLVGGSVIGVAKCLSEVDSILRVFAVCFMGLAFFLLGGFISALNKGIARYKGKNQEGD